MFTKIEKIHKWHQHSFNSDQLLYDNTSSAHFSRLLCNEDDDYDDDDDEEDDDDDDVDDDNDDDYDDDSTYQNQEGLWIEQ